MTEVLSLLLGVLVVLAITVLTGYFVAQEFAYMAVDRSQLGARAAAGDTAAERALTVTRRTSFMLSGAQLGITVTGLLVGYVAEPLIGESLGALLGGVGIPTAVGIGIGAVLALLFSTVVQMVFGELFPKNLAIARPEPVARWLATSTTVYLRLFGWLIWVFDQASNLLLKVLRIEPVHDVEHAATARDLEHIVEDSRDSGDLPVELSMMLDRILDFPRRTVEHAMIPRSRVDVVVDTDALGHVRELMSHGHSRYPVLAEDSHDVVGVVQLAEVLATTEPDSAPVTAITRPALVVSHLTPLPDVLRELDEAKSQLACVVDEYGGFTGVITVEDLAEELVGEITDEHDAEVNPGYVPVEGDGVWEMPGDVHVDEVERSLGTDLPRGDYETVAGLVIAHHGGLPEEGARLEIALPPDPGDLAHAGEPAPRALSVEVLAVDRHVPSRVRLVLPAVAAAQTAGERTR
ncbi:hemolysin family protein [Geodermatophilus sp. DSM 44513]|uniref:hemolysin family protein n=1 Tax=Geodermatophilus sp. DSM 44513 TaxID=1528104 RepID=UPI00126AA413|nr:hemolysin family protein [Geodermatophilus sp. DSM 44513]WNV76837.1 hemolysin family protein [Geodermatophilus sp. DSM 44513]